jgi:FHA domain
VRAVGSPTEFSFDQFEMENDDTQVMAGAEGSGDWHHDAPTTPIEPTVEAVRCPHGHPNAPGSATCRICEASIANQTVELIPAPLLARLRTADGTVVDLDRAVLLGRAPSEQRSTAALPRLVTLASPAQDISRTHLQVTPEDWQVMATDLESTNGTFVTDRRGKRSLLPAGQPTPVQIGAVLDLGEGVSVTVEPAE